MLTLVRHARRRLLFNELFSEGANATSAALIAFILLLLLGTQILNWHWLVVIPLAAAGAGVYRVRKRLPPPYTVAQVVDHRLDLADALSTALYFSEPASARGGSEEVRRLQYESADRLSQSLDVRKAIPYRMPRAAYLMAALTLVASSLFALRYGLNRRLDLKPPLATILQQTFGSEKTEIARNSQKKTPAEAAPQQDESSDTAGDEDQTSGDSQDDSANVSEDSNESRDAGADSRKPGADQKKQSEEGEKAESDQQNGSDEDREGNDGGNSGDQQGNGKPDQKQDSGTKQDANSSSENSSLMSKVKDAMQNLLSRMKPQQGQQGSQQSSMDQKGSQGKGQQSGTKQQASKDGQQQNSGQSDAQDGQASEQAQNGDPQGKGTGKSDTPQISKQPGSGIGSQDGDKNIKQAEQLAAMGKISEILGRRSATISGESTVEVQNTSQQLHTPYAQRGAQHSQGGAEINRDEVPVALQSYVEQYFEQVRKHTAPAKK